MPGHVTVYLKHPAGIVMRLHTKQVVKETAPGGMTRDVEVSVPTGDRFVLNGTAAPFGHGRKDRNGNFVMIVGGYAVTPQVPKDMWDRWLVENAESDLVRNKLIYAHEKPVEGESWAKDHAATRTGLEPLTPTLTDGGGRVTQADARAPRGVALADRAA